MRIQLIEFGWGKDPTSESRIGYGAAKVKWVGWNQRFMWPKSEQQMKKKTKRSKMSKSYASSWQFKIKYKFRVKGKMLELTLDLDGIMALCASICFFDPVWYYIFG